MEETMSTDERPAWIQNAAALASNAANKLDCAVQLSGDTLSLEIDMLEDQLDTIAKRLKALNEEGHWWLCLNCGQITPMSWWGLWKRDEEGENWIPSEPGDSDPMCECPTCRWQHQDTDGNPGVFDGTYKECVAARADELARDHNYPDWWNDALAEAKAKRGVPA